MISRRGTKEMTKFAEVYKSCWVSEDEKEVSEVSEAEKAVMSLINK